MNIRKYIFYIALFSIPAMALAEKVTTRTGYAYAIESNELVYIEVHTETWGNGLLQTDAVEYRQANGTLIATKNIDYRHSQFMPDFELNNLLTGHHEQAAKQADQYKVKFLKKSNKTMKEKTLSLPANGVSDAGFDRAIEQEWDKLITGETIKKDFLIPSLLRFITFKIYQDKVVDDPKGSYRRIIIEANSLFVRLATGSINVDYAINKPQLLKFVGMTNMRDENGDNYHLAISYSKTEEQLAENSPQDQQK